MRTIYSKYNFKRKPEFQISTSIVISDSNEKFTIKKAITRESKKYIETLYDNHSLVRANFDEKIFLPKVIEKNENFIKFEYIDGESLAEKLLLAFHNKDENLYLSLIKNFRDILLGSSKPSTNKYNNVSDEFFRDIDMNFPEAAPQMSDICCVDMNFENIILNNNNYYLIDCEWIFRKKFPTVIPLIRGIRLFYNKYSEFGVENFFPIYKLFEKLNLSLDWVAVVDALGKILPKYVNVEKKHIKRITDKDIIEQKELQFFEPEQFPAKKNSDVRTIAFYLPQYHPFEENDNFWGKGFTEWTNVVKALPQFEGHYQPKLPGELGYYDLRLKDVMKRQIELAKQYGIFGFCFHHYWFSGKPVMRVPYNHIISNPDLDIPFCLNWANEPWTSSWDGLPESKVLIEQKHTPADDIAFIKDIEPALKDKRYIRVEGKPLLVIYRPKLFPNMKETVNRWNAYCEERGIGKLYLAMMQTCFDNSLDPNIYGFDAAIEFMPHNIQITRQNSRVNFFDSKDHCDVYSYTEMVKNNLARAKPAYTLFKGLIPGWDVTPRRISGSAFIDQYPAEYQKWLREEFKYSKQNLPEDKRLIFINAWNEWGEGAYLEPDNKFGYAYLNATSRANHISFPKVAVVLHIYFGDLAEEIAKYLKNIPVTFDLYVSTKPELKEKLLTFFAKHFGKDHVTVHAVENRGSDIIPFIREFRDAYGKYDYVCKIHSKKSEFIFTERKEGSNWRRYLLDNLLGSFDKVEAIFEYFNKNEKLGVIYPPTFPNEFIEKSMTWGVNFEKGLSIAKKLDIFISNKGKLDFSAGTMFWFRPKALQSLFSLDYHAGDFKHGSNIGRDGSLAHAFERIILCVCESNGYTHKQVLFDDNKKEKTLNKIIATMTNEPANNQKINDPVVIENLYKHIQAEHAEIMEIKHSFSYKLGWILTYPLRAFVPIGSKREYYFKKILNKLLRYTTSYYPKISLILPTHNATPQYLDECIQSVFDQSYKNWELCIYDDGSKNEYLLSCLREWVDYDNRIKIIFGEQNTGLLHATNEGIKMSSGEFFAFLGQDDILDKEALHKITQCINSNPDLDLICSEFDNLIDFQDQAADNPSSLIQSIIPPPVLCFSLNVYRKEVVDKIGEIKQEYGCSLANNLKIQLIRSGKKAFRLDSKLYYRRKIFVNIKNDYDNILRENLRQFLSAKRKIFFPNFFSPKISVVLVLKNSAEFTLRCVQALAENNFESFEIIIVDNSSDDETKDLLKLFEGNVKTVNTRNQALKLAKGKYLLYLDNDTLVIPDSISKAIKTIDGSDSIGSVGGKLILPDGTLAQAGGIILSDGDTMDYGRGDKPFAPMYNFKRTVNFCSDSFLITRRKTNKKLCVVYDPDIIAVCLKSAMNIKETGNIDYSNILQARHAIKNTNILIIDEKIPYPRLGAGFPRSNQILYGFAELGYNVTLFPTEKFFYPNDKYDLYYSFPRENLPDTTEIIFGQDANNLEVFMQKRQNYYDVIWVSRPHNVKLLNSILKKHPDWFKNIKIIYDAEALACLREIEHRKLRGEKPSEIEESKLIEEETSLSKDLHATVVVSNREREYFSKFDTKNLFVLGHSINRTIHTKKHFRDRKGLLFIGPTYRDTTPNSDSMLWFINEVLPIINNSLDQKIRLTICGECWCEKIKKLASADIEIVGITGDLSPFYENARVFIAPTRFASGLPYKAHHAASFGLPMVSTPLIAKQLNWTDGEELLVGNTAKEFASKCMELYTNYPLWKSIRSKSIKRVTVDCAHNSFVSTLNSIINSTK